MLSPTGPSLRLKTLAKGKPTIGVLAEMVAMAPQFDWWHTYLAILFVDEVENNNLLPRHPFRIIVNVHKFSVLKSCDQLEPTWEFVHILPGSLVMRRGSTSFCLCVSPSFHRAV